MKVLSLGIKPSPLKSILEKNNCKVIERTDPIDLEFFNSSKVDFAVSYRFRHIVRKPIIEHLRGNIINLHISLLPWNRGADPNLWSFLENTPKGITIHYIDDGIDTGDIIAQKELFFDENKETIDAINPLDSSFFSVAAGGLGRPGAIDATAGRSG